MELTKLATAVRMLREELDTKEPKLPGQKTLPAYFLDFFMLTAAAGEKGITTIELSEQTGLSQSLASRTVKMLSTYKIDDVTRGPGLVVKGYDEEFQHRQRIFLSPKGRKLAAKLKKLME